MFDTLFLINVFTNPNAHTILFISIW